MVNRLGLLELLSTKSEQVSLIHTHTDGCIQGNSRFSILHLDTLAYGPEEPGIDPLTF